MSIREDARNERLVKEALGYDPEKVIAQLREENRVLRERCIKLERALTALNGCD